MKSIREIELAENHKKLIEEVLSGRLRIGGASQSYATLASNPAALTTGSVNILQVPSPSQTPLMLAIGYIPNTTTVAAAATCTYSLNRLDTPAVFSSAIQTNTGAGSSAVGPCTVIGIVPFGVPAGSNISLSGLGSAGGPQPIGAATTPIILALLGLA